MLALRESDPPHPGDVLHHPRVGFLRVDRVEDAMVTAFPLNAGFQSKLYNPAATSNTAIVTSAVEPSGADEIDVGKCSADTFG